LNLLEQLTTYYGSDIGLNQVQAILGITGDRRIRELARHILSSNLAAGMATLSSLNSDGLDPAQFNRELVVYLRALLLAKTGSGESIDLPAEDIAELKELAGRTSLAQILKAVKLFGQINLSLDNYSTLPLELALVDATMPSGKEPPVTKVEPEVQPPARPVAPEAPPPAAEKTTARTEGRARPAAEQKRERKPEPARAEAESPPEPEPVTAPAPEEEKSPPEPEPAPVSAEPAPVTTAGAGGEEMEYLQSNWLKFIREAPASMSRSPAAALLRSAKPKAIEKNTVILSFKFPLHKESMEKTDNLQIAEQIISNFLGRACRVRCVSEPEANHLIEEALKIGAQIIESEEK